MRRVLDGIYTGAALLAALCMVATLVLVLANILDRYITLPFRGLDMYAGYAMAGAGFLSLAHTFKRGEHIRVTLVLNALKPRGRRHLDTFALLLGALVSALFTYYSVRLVSNSLAFHDISTGNDATPLWIPQLVMAVGAVVLSIALLDELILALTGRRTEAASEEPLRSE
ncbi:TRAP transporter small permease [Piscinibacter koreensis]|uniref:TRAP transporter small permease protein n=1 Tax=Piscinibacter koreensis TaxID=2742824 RepID=A0A7Y6NJW8_9BURK|nr:TRAP transporter small permease [Schlegelella koreensis]NUZ04546.1 TRAP transporter small permease [Schlegelella koreensis]